MLQGFARALQLIALVVVGSALMLGVAYDALRAEIGLLAIGGALFLLGRWLERSA